MVLDAGGKQGVYEDGTLKSLLHCSPSVDVPDRTLQEEIASVDAGRFLLKYGHIHDILWELSNPEKLSRCI